MTWRLLFLAALWLPELPLHPASGDLPMGWPHLLGTDALGRDGLLRLLLAAARSFGFASAVALIALALALPAACGKGRPASLWSALRALPPLLVLLPLSRRDGIEVARGDPGSNGLPDGCEHVGDDHAGIGHQA